METGTRPVIVWFRRDLRLTDHAALAAAAAEGRPVIPLFILDETAEALGAAPKWRLGLGVETFATALAGRGSRLVLRRGKALQVLGALIAETGAAAVYWMHYPEPAHLVRDRACAEALRRDGLTVRVFGGHTLLSPDSVATLDGRPYAVFTPFWRAIRTRDPGPVLAAPNRLIAPAVWPESERIGDWRLHAGMGRGHRIVAPYLRVGEAAAEARLAAFADRRLASYADRRDFPAEPATSGLSENLAWGEISPRRVWHRVSGWLDHPGSAVSAERFLTELGWREFAWHLMAHDPDLARRSWRRGWDRFPWRSDNEDAERWRRAATGEPFVDAGLREMYVTGRMHNRARMIVASYLTKHLLTDWRVGLAWFQDCLSDWDPAANALGWQWAAGSGPDAAPFFRIFNPAVQAERFDPDHHYRRRFGTGGQKPLGPEALAYFAAVPRSWQLDPDLHLEPVIGLRQGRDRALAAHARFVARMTKPLPEPNSLR